MNLLWWKGSERFHDSGELFVIFNRKSAGTGKKFIQMDGKGVGYFSNVFKVGLFCPLSSSPRKAGLIPASQASFSWDSPFNLRKYLILAPISIYIS